MISQRDKNSGYTKRSLHSNPVFYVDLALKKMREHVSSNKSIGCLIFIAASGAVGAAAILGYNMTRKDLQFTCGKPFNEKISLINPPVLKLFVAEDRPEARPDLENTYLKMMSRISDPVGPQEEKMKTPIEES